jgi:hypothetical protein
MSKEAVQTFSNDSVRSLLSAAKSAYELLRVM